MADQPAPEVGADGPTAVFGVPVRDGERHLAEALDSLAAQTIAAGVVVVDDCSTDRSPGLVAARGLPYERSDRRLGLVGCWRRAFELALARFPSARYFAWGSDHDVWDPEWLETLAGALDQRPGAVLAYPVVRAIGADGEPLRRRPRHFDTAGVADPLERMRAANAGMRAGDMVYGLYRVDALRRCGPFPATLLPDRLLLARLALEGEFVQVDRPLWSRRYREGVRHSLARQRRSLYGPRTPRTARLPWWAPHAVCFFRSLQGDAADRLGTTAVYVTSAYGAVRGERREAAARRRRRRNDARLRRLSALRRGLPAPLVRLSEPLARRARRRGG